MTRSNSTKALLSLSWLLAVTGMDCWEGETIVYQFEALRCPDAAYRLSDTIVASPFHFTFFPEHFPTCPGFKPHVFGQEPGPLDVRLSRGPSCTLDVAYTYLTPPGAPQERSRALEREQRRRAGLLVESLLKTLGSGAAIPAATERRFESPDDLLAWCNLTTGTKGDSS